VNIVDIVVVFVLAIAILGGWFRGFVETLLGLGATLLSCVLGFVGIPLVANAVRGNASLYQMLLYYTEGAEYVAETSVELTRTSIHNVSAEEVRTIVQNAEMPLPMGNRVMKNIAMESFAAEGVTTLGDYFNLTIVSVVIHIFAFFVVFLLCRALFGVIIRGIGYGRDGYPVLIRFDGPLGASIGLFQGILFLFVCFLLLPVALTVLPKLYEFVQESFFGEFFYRANLLIHLMPS